MERRWMFVLAIILVAGLALRLLALAMAPQQIFFEPDNFYYFAVMKETVANNWLIPQHLPLSGIGIHTQYQEFPGLIYATVIPYWLLGETIPLIWVMYAMPVIFGIAGIVVTYLLTKKLFRNEKAAIAGAALYSLIPAAVYRTAAMQYRGESFVPLLLALFVLCQVSGKRSYRLVSWALIPISLVFWKASAYILPVIAIAFFLMYMDEKWSAREKGAALAIIFILALIAAHYALALLEWSPNIEAAILEAQPPSLGYAFLTLGVSLIFAPMAWCMLFMKHKKKNNEKVLWAWLSAILLVMVPFFILQLRWVFLLGIPMSVFGGMGFVRTYAWLKKRRIRVSVPLFMAIALMFSYSISLTYLVGQDAGIVIAHIPEVKAAAWIANNTANNSTFLAFWGDSSIIEGWGNRTSYTDSTNANGTRVVAYAKFMLTDSGNYSYLKYVRPNYLFVSNWTNVTIFEQEGNMTNDMINVSGTNYWHLTHGTAALPIIYNYNGVIIYNATGLWNGLG